MGPRIQCISWQLTTWKTLLRAVTKGEDKEVKAFIIEGIYKTRKADPTEMNYFSDLVLVLDSFLSRDKSGRRTTD